MPSVTQWDGTSGLLFKEGEGQFLTLVRSGPTNPAPASRMSSLVRTWEEPPSALQLCLLALHSMHRRCRPCTAPAASRPTPSWSRTYRARTSNSTFARISSSRGSRRGSTFALLGTWSRNALMSVRTMRRGQRSASAPTLASVGSLSPSSTASFAASTPSARLLTATTRTRSLFGSSSVSTRTQSFSEPRASLRDQ